MHKLSTKCVQLVRNVRVFFVDIFAQIIGVCTNSQLDTCYSNFFTPSIHTMCGHNIFGRLVTFHTFHTTYINSSILPKSFINIKHSGELV